MRVVTGTVSGNDGTLEVVVNGQDVSSDSVYALGSTVLDQCFDPVSSVFIRNPTTNAWAGSIEVSTDGGTSWSAMYCASCTGGGTTTDSIVVDGDDGHSFATQCVNGNSCELFWGVM